MPDHEHVETYDTTLRDGSQQVGLQFTVADKLRVTRPVSYTHLTLPTILRV